MSDTDSTSTGHQASAGCRLEGSLADRPSVCVSLRNVNGCLGKKTKNKLATTACLLCERNDSWRRTNTPVGRQSAQLLQPTQRAAVCLTSGGPITPGSGLTAPPRLCDSLEFMKLRALTQHGPPRTAGRGDRGASSRRRSPGSRKGEGGWGWGWRG